MGVRVSTPARATSPRATSRSATSTTLAKGAASSSGQGRRLPQGAAPVLASPPPDLSRRRSKDEVKALPQPCQASSTSALHARGFVAERRGVVQTQVQGSRRKGGGEAKQRRRPSSSSASSSHPPTPSCRFRARWLGRSVAARDPARRASRCRSWAVTTLPASRPAGRRSSGLRGAPPQVGVVRGGSGTGGPSLGLGDAEAGASTSCSPCSALPKGELPARHSGRVPKGQARQ